MTQRSKCFGLTVLLLAAAGMMHAQSDSVLTEQMLLNNLRENHPVAVQSRLILQQGERTVQQARGGFDPKLSGGVDQKFYDGKTYYEYLGTGLKIPTWYGVEVKAQWDQTRGVFLNPEATLPEPGQWAAGISVPLGKGLFIDERRAVLQQAQIFSASTRAQQRQMLNNLNYEALQQYWSWSAAWNIREVYLEAQELARIRFEAVRQSFALGDEPAIDTLEAFIQLQNRQLLLAQAQLDLERERLALNNYLWLKGQVPLELSTGMRPPMENFAPAPAWPRDSLLQWERGLAAQHPELLAYDFKLAELDVKRRMKLEALKPDLRAEYNFLTSPSDVALDGAFPSDYKWGLTLDFPLFLRKERGGLRLVEIQQQDTRLGQQQKALSLRNKMRYYGFAQENLGGQFVQYADNVANYRALLRGEQQKFQVGESSLFLINQREVKLIEARLKLTEIWAKQNLARHAVRWAAGILGDG